jgi:outer membrane protein assembly factor BamB
MSSSSRLSVTPFALTALAILAWAWINDLPDFDFNYLAWANWAIGLLLGVLLLAWFVFFSPFRWKTRLITAAVLLGSLGLLRLCVRLDGAVSGTGLPRYCWAWEESVERKLPQEMKQAITTPTVVASASSEQFRGNDRSGVINSQFSTDWLAHPPKELWRIDVGEGWGGFCVIDHRAITQEQRGEEEWVSCYDLGTGTLLWHHATNARFTQWQGGDGPRGTPTHRDGKLYTMGGTGLLHCLDLDTGKALWTRDTFKDHNGINLKWGISGSPLLHEDQVIVTGGDEPGPSLLSYDASTGAPRWKAGSSGASYASPALATLCGQLVILSHEASGLSPHDPATGQILAQAPFGSEIFPRAAQPLVIPGDQIFLSAGYGMGCVLLQAAKSDGTIRFTELWRHNKMKTQFCSTLLAKDRIYGLDDGRLACLDLATGERLWKEGRYGAGQCLLLPNLSPQLHALVQSEPGPVYLIQIQLDAPKEIAKLDALSSKTWNYPTLAGKHLILRNDRQAVCYELN